MTDPLSLAAATDRALREVYSALERRYAAQCGWCGSVQKVAVPGSTPMCDDCLDTLYPEEGAK